MCLLKLQGVYSSTPSSCCHYCEPFKATTFASCSKYRARGHPQPRLPFRQIQPERALARPSSHLAWDGILPTQKRCAYILTTGSTMIDQFEPWYFGVAFSFCFKCSILSVPYTMLSCCGSLASSFFFDSIFVFSSSESELAEELPFSTCMSGACS